MHQNQRISVSKLLVSPLQFYFLPLPAAIMIRFTVTTMADVTPRVKIFPLTFPLQNIYPSK